MRTKIKEIGNRLLSGFLAFLMMVSLAPVSAFAAEPAEVTDENGFVDLKVYPMMGGYGKQYAKEPHSVSFFTNIMLWEDNSLDVPRSCYGFYVTAEYKAGSSTADKTVSLIAQVEREPDIDAAGRVINSAKSESGKAELMISLDMTKTDNEKFIWYFVAGGGGHTTKLSVEVNRLHSARSWVTSTYSRVGIQVRVIDNHPLGIGNYMDNQSNFAPNSGPDAMLTNPTGTYTGMDGLTYDNSYFDLILESSPDTTNDVVTVENLDEFYAWLNRYYIPEANRMGIALGDTITLAGPAYVRGKNTRTNPTTIKYYNLAYYAKNEGQKNTVDRNKAGTITKESVNTFAAWGQNTKLDFVRLAYCKLILPTVRTGKVRVEYYNEANPTQQIKDPDTIDTDSFRMTSNYADLRTNILNKLSSKVMDTFFTNNGTDEPLAMVKDNTIASKFTEFKESATSLVFDTAQNKLTVKQDADVSQELKALRKYVDARNSVAKQFKDGKLDTGVNLTSSDLKTSNGSITLENVKNYLGIYDIVPPEIPGYTFDFGIGTDALAKRGYGAVVMLADDPSVSVIVDQQTAEAVVKLYYKGGTGYTVKVSVDGVIDESLTKQYTASVGTVIRKEDVDTSIVPSDATIKNIINVPLTVDPDPTKNIIIIECTNKELPYKIQYFLDGVLKETDTDTAPEGTEILAVPIKYYPGYKYDHTDGTPLTIVNDKGVIRVYYKKDTVGTGTYGVAKLFSNDQYTNLVTVYKSGYGVYGQFKVNFADLAAEKEYPQWDIPGCGPRPTSTVKDKYKDFNVTATATYYEGLNTNGTQNKNGRRITVNMVKDTRRSTATEWVFTFPLNRAAASNRQYNKAYIPINWPDNTRWEVTFNATITAKQYVWWNGHDTYTHVVGYIMGAPITHNHGYRTLEDNNYNLNFSTTRTATASIMINRSMYEDDFTGDRH